MERRINESRVIQYDIIRVVTTLLVVVGHAHYHVIATNFGGCDYTYLVGQGNISWKIARLITHFLNTVTMPVFMALGGALFFRNMERGKFPTLVSLVKNKTKRLLIPFVVVATFYVFPVKLLCGYYENSENVLFDFFVGQILNQGNIHLWYLPTMFADFLICYVLEKYIKIPPWGKLAVLGAISVVMWNYPVNMVAYVSRYMVWFYAGYCFEQVRPAFRWCERYAWGLSGCAITGITFLFTVGAINGTGVWSIVQTLCLRLIIPAAAGISMYSLASATVQSKWVSGKLFTCLQRNTFGIYLYSDPINYVILMLAAAGNGPFFFGSVPGVMVMYFLRIVITLVWSILVSEVLRYCKVKYLV